MIVFFCKYLLGSLPSVNIFPLFTIVKKMTNQFAKWRKCNRMVLKFEFPSRLLFANVQSSFVFISKVIVKSSAISKLLLLVLTACLYTERYVLNIFRKRFWARHHTSSSLAIIPLVPSAFFLNNRGKYETFCTIGNFDS